MRIIRKIFLLLAILTFSLLIYSFYVVNLGHLSDRNINIVCDNPALPGEIPYNCLPILFARENTIFSTPIYLFIFLFFMSGYFVTRVFGEKK